MTRERVLEAIRQSAEEIGRVPGARKFYTHSGVSKTDLWNAGFARYSEAVEAAGLEPNRLQKAHSTEAMLNKLAQLVRDLGRFPSISDLKTARARDKSIPSYDSYFRLGRRSLGRVRDLLVQHCRDVPELGDVVPLLLADSRTERKTPKSGPKRVTGYVYLAKLGCDYKIGRSNDVASRRREISLLLPQELEHVHVIETDDPVGIERYWHERFREKRTRGEWFRLTADDVAAFKRRRYQ